MANAKISALNEVVGANLDDEDVLAIVNSTETKKVKFNELISTAGLNKLSGTPIPSGKVAFASGAIVEASMAANSVNTAAVKDDNITGAKLANNATALFASSAPTAEYTGQLWVDTDDDKVYIWDGSSWDALVAGTTTISGSTSGIINIVSTASGTTYTISATVDDTDAANKFLAGPTGAGGAVTARTIAGSDLPDPTTSAKGGVIINGNGLTQSSGTIKIDNTVTASGSTYSVCQHDANGLVSASRAVTSADLPLATSSATGAVKPGTGLSVDGNGALTITNSVTGATKGKVTYDANGLITAGADLVAGDIPDLSAAKITSGTLDIARIADDSVTAAKMANSSTCLVQSIAQAGFPTAVFTGQLLFDSVAEDAYLWDGNAWQAITTLTKGSLVNGGTFNASTSKMASVTTAGSAAGLVVGSNLPTASSTTDGVYVVVATAGTPSAPAPVTALNPPDYILGVTNSSGSTWNEIDLSATVSGQIAQNVGFTPYGQIGSSNCQDAIEELETEKMPKAGGTFTGAVEIGTGGSLSFEGATGDGYETTIAVTDPTADRTLTLPNQSGNFLIAGNASIANADVATNAAIDYSKLAALADGKILVGNSSNIPTAVTPSGDVTISNAGVFSYSAGSIVNADINASAAIAGSKLAAGSTSAQGAVQLSDAADSTSTSLAATANRIKVLTDEKAALTGATFTGDVQVTGSSANILFDVSDDALEFADNAKATFGTGTDLSISHDGSNSYIDDAGTGALRIRGSSIEIKKQAADETLAKFTADGACELYQDNVKHFETNAAGCAVTGDLTVSGAASCAFSSVNYAASLTLDLTTANNFTIGALTGAIAINNPSAMTVGSGGVIMLTQDGSGGQVASWGSYWHFAGGDTTGGVLSTAASAVDALAYTVVSASSIVCYIHKAVAD